jgi:putative redox protein
MAKRIKVEFSGTDGLMVAGLLETPDSSPHSFALFAHCFTCGKDVLSASRISRALAFKWLHILYCCWQSRTPYDESKYLLI